MAHAGKKVYAGKKLVSKRIDRAVKKATAAASKPKSKSIAQLLREARFLKLYNEPQEERQSKSRLEAERNVAALEKSRESEVPRQIPELRGSDFLQNIRRGAESGRSLVDEAFRRLQARQEERPTVCTRCGEPTMVPDGVMLAICSRCQEQVLERLRGMHPLTDRTRGRGSGR